MEDLDLQLRRLRRRAGRLAATVRGLRYAAVWALLWGTVVLAARIGFELPSGPFLWGAAGLPLVLLAAGLRARRGLPSEAVLRAALDGRSTAGGLMMASAEVPLRDWAQRVPAVRRLEIKARWPGSALLCAAAVLYTAASFAVPVQGGPQTVDPSLDVEQEAETLEEQIEALREQGLLEEEQALALQEQLDDLRIEASGTDPAWTWEALDHLQELAESTAAEAAEAALAEAQRLAETESLLAELQDALAEGTLTPQERRAAAAELEAAAKAAGLDPELLEQLGGDGEAGLSAEQLERLAQAVDAAQGGQLEQLQQLAEAGLLDAETLRRLAAQAGAGGGEGDGMGELEDFLAENLGEAGNPRYQQGRAQRSSGQAGVSRGRGDAAMNWKNETEEAGARFEAVTLPPSAVESLGDSRVVQTSFGAPQEAPGTPAAPGGGLGGGEAAGGSAVTQPVLPQHRGAVRRYFERQ